jgi:hypothetical protein
MPFPSRKAPEEPTLRIPSSRPLPTSRHTRKNSKVAQLLGIAGTPEKARDAVNAVHPHVFMSPPLLPMEADPFSRPLGATIVSNVTPTTQRQMTGPPDRHTFRSMQSMPSLSVPAERHATHTHVPRIYAPQSTSDLHVAADTAARRAPRPLQRAGYAHIGTQSSRSLSNPPPTPSVPSHHTSTSAPLQPSRAVNLENKSRHGLTSTHTTHRGRHQNTRDFAPMAARDLRKARSSVVLSNTRMPPLHAPKPVKALERPSVETLHKFAESARSASAMPNHSNSRNREVAVPAVWPPAPVLRPPRIVNPERDAYRTAAIEAEKTCLRINEERALLEHVRDVGDREARRRERDPGDPSHRSRHHRRAATEGSRRRKREVEYRTMGDYGYDPTHQKWVGAR